MKLDLNTLDLDHLHALLGNYENELKSISKKGYSWQETYFISDKISENISAVHTAISRINPVQAAQNIN